MERKVFPWLWPHHNNLIKLCQCRICSATSYLRLTRIAIPVYNGIILERCETLSIGQVGVFVYDGEGYLKSYGEREPDESDRDAFTDSYGRLHMQPVLISYNKDYSDRIISPERGFRVIGRVL